MYTDAHIASLLEVITEQRNRIKTLEADLAACREEEDRNWKWYCEEKEKTSQLEGQIALTTTIKPE
jgi:hypothetical protein